MKNKKKNPKTFEWWYVYRDTNNTKKEIYHGVSKDVEARKDGKHCKSNTKIIAHWDCEIDKISWGKLSKHKSQKKASEISHHFEHTFSKEGYTIYITSGI